MKVNQKLHQAKLAKWVALLQDQASSGLPVKEWCAQNDHFQLNPAKAAPASAL